MAVIEEIIEKKVSPIIEKQPNEKRPAKEQSAETITEPDTDGDVFFESEEYPAEELKQLIQQASEYKTKGNTFFGQSEYTKAITEYENALMTCPESLVKERAVYFGNIAACHLKQDEYKDARDMCTQALKLDPTYVKALLRRAQANEKINSSSSMQAALDDYKTLKPLVHDTYTLRQCQRAETDLPNKIKQKMEQEKEEMMGKLKDLGNSLLGKFGLSTDNFQLQQDSGGSGGYSMNFVNSPKK
ncbi:hypothetical protein BDF21DRAFT_417920 [Thamnidium elegans]|uniref:Tetratricopeptide repeat protein 1 n=1 Tax=Thamnidium elegans TaxID=101142 RepID=A0A8H7STH2_9FUNG|nr:hypothetical protein INT48_008112 [Thamnidium elegans]KAI8082458.1 hypothetical protein BDF21DRAFT_417920 [Thamnidium elegans]